MKHQLNELGVVALTSWGLGAGATGDQRHAGGEVVSAWPSQHFEPHQIAPGKQPAIVLRAAHLYRGLELSTDRRPFGSAKNLAAFLMVQLHAGHASGLAVENASELGIRPVGDAAFPVAFYIRHVSGTNG